MHLRREIVGSVGLGFEGDPFAWWSDPTASYFAPAFLSSYARGSYGARRRHVAGFDLGGALGDVVNAAGDVVNAAANVVSSIPGVGAAVQFFGSELKDFANTTIGQIALDMFASYVFPEVAMVVGPQLASASFAIPGLAKGEGFVQAWLTDFMKRLEQLADIEGADVAGAIAGQLQPALEQLEQMAEQAGIDPTQYANQLESYTSSQVHALAQQLGVRDDMLQSAIDYLSGQATIAVDAATKAAEQKAWDALRAALPGLPSTNPDFGTGGTEDFRSDDGQFHESAAALVDRGVEPIEAGEGESSRRESRRAAPKNGAPDGCGASCGRGRCTVDRRQSGRR